jgi:hypothetical protein
VVAAVDADDLAAGAGAVVRGEVDRRAAHRFKRGVDAQGGVRLGLAEGLARAADRRAGQRLHRPGGDRVDADPVGAQVVRQIAHRRFQCRLGHAHHVVIGRHAVGALIGQRQDRAAIGHQMRGPPRHVDQRKARDRQRIAKVLARGVDEAAGQLVLVGIGDRVDHEIQAAPFLLERGEGRVQRGIVHHVDLDQNVRAQAFRQRLHALAKGLSLVGEGKLCPFGGHRLGDAPGDRAVVGDAHDQPALALHQIGHDGCSLNPNIC